MKLNKVISQMIKAGLLTGIAILVGSFAHFTIVGQVCLIGAIVFVMPLFLRFDFLIISAVASTTISDVISGYGNLVWITGIVYAAAIIVLWVFTKMKFKGMYYLGLLLASLVIVAGYFLLEWSAFGMAYAIKDLIGTSIQVSICIPIASILYYPLKIVALVIKK